MSQTDCDRKANLCRILMIVETNDVHNMYEATFYFNLIFRTLSAMVIMLCKGKRFFDIIVFQCRSCIFPSE